MKKQKILLLLLSLFSFSLLSQQSYYINLNAGYGFKQINDDLGSPFDEIGLIDIKMNTDSSILVKPLTGTLGSGLKLGLGAGYMISSNVGLEVQFNYYKSPEITLGTQESPKYNASHKVKTFRVTAIPTLVFKLGSGKFKPYLKAGLIIPLHGRTDSYVRIQDREGRLLDSYLVEGFLGVDLSTIDPSSIQIDILVDTDIEGQSFGKFSLGVQTTLGLSYHINDHLAINAELYHETISIPIKSSEITKFDLAVDLSGLPINIPIKELSEVSPYYVEIIYLDELTSQSNNEAYNSNFDPEKPKEDLSFKNNYNSLGIQVGLSYFF